MNYGSADMVEPAWRKVGMVSSLALAVMTLVTFTIAFLTPPLSGPMAGGPRIIYPYTDILTRFPRDYYWMYPAMVLMLIFIVYMVAVDQYAPPSQRIFSRIAVTLAALGAGIILVDYFVQLTVIQPSLLNGEVEGIALLTQYNPHGIFIALEEAGYLLMAIAIVFLAPVFKGGGRLKGALRWTAILNFTLTIIAFIVISAMFGVSREYRFEIAVITLDFMTLVVLGLLSIWLFKSKTNK